MSDDKTKRGSPDNKLLNTNEPYELAYMAAKEKTTPERLKQAAASVGSSREKIKEWLDRYGR